MNTKKTKLKRKPAPKKYRCKACGYIFFARGNLIHHYATRPCGKKR